MSSSDRYLPLFLVACCVVVPHVSLHGRNLGVDAGDDDDEALILRLVAKLVASVTPGDPM